MPGIGIGVLFYLGTRLFRTEDAAELKEETRDREAGGGVAAAPGVLAGSDRSSASAASSTRRPGVRRTTEDTLEANAREDNVSETWAG